MCSLKLLNDDDIKQAKSHNFINVEGIKTLKACNTTGHFPDRLLTGSKRRRINDKTGRNHRRS